jgi:hypothetical protein
VGIERGLGDWDMVVVLIEWIWFLVSWYNVLVVVER